MCTGKIGPALEFYVKMSGKIGRCSMAPFKSQRPQTLLDVRLV